MDFKKLNKLYPHKSVLKINLHKQFLKKISKTLGVLGIIGIAILINNCGKTLPPKVSSAQHASYPIVAPAVVDSIKDVTRLSISHPGIISKIFVSSGSLVEEHAPLIALNSADEELAVILQKDKIAVQNAQLLLAQNLLEDAKRRHQFFTGIGDVRAVSKIEMDSITNKLNEAKLQVTAEQKKLLAVQTQLKEAEVQLAERTLLAPNKSIVLQINVHPGEYVIPSFAKPVILLGDAEKVWVRVAIDEREAWRFDKKAAAYLTSIGNQNLTIPITFERIEPYTVSKEFSLSQYSYTADARALEVIYYFKRAQFPSVYPGQQFDAHIGISHEASIK